METGLIDYDKLEEQAMVFQPKILLCGGSAYPREWDYARLRKVADACGAILFCDMAHISGLVQGVSWTVPSSTVTSCRLQPTNHFVDLEVV